MKGKNAVIIGASRGIGEAIARNLYSKGCNVFITGRRTEDLSNITSSLSKPGAHSSHHKADISSPGEMKAAFRAYQDLGWGGIDILVNNAGIYRENSSTHSLSTDGEVDFDWETINDLIQTNMLGYFISTELARPLMRDNGSIVHISSVNGLRGKGGCDIYDMTKAGINVLTLNHARQFAPKGIRVNAVCPSSTVTPMRDDALGRYLPDGVQRRDFDESEAKSVPFQRLGKPEDIAQMVAFLSSDESCYTTGQIISVDGGYGLIPTFPSFNH
jgi:3-oxoacyl-[acyl-carrier protein] reductase